MSAWLALPGIACALGCGMATVLARALRGDTSGLRSADGWVPGRRILIGQAPGTPRFPAGLAPHHDTRNNRLLLAAAAQIEGLLRAAVERHGSGRVAIVLGTSTSGVNDNAPAFSDLLQTGAWPAGYDYRRQALSAPAECMADWLGCRGLAYTISTACTSGARALLSARRLLELGACDAVVCGAADSLCRLTLNGFHALDALAPDLCNPCSRHRHGINVGEGAAVFLMQRERPHGPAVQLLGGGASSDAWHPSAPHPQGTGARLAMQAALRDARIDADDVAWVNLHGTGTQHNDAMESHAMHAVFPGGVPCTSTKPLTGHALGAAGAVEAALCWGVLSSLNPQHALPPHRWDGHADPALPPMDLTAAGLSLPAARPRIVMSNSYAFGGNNASLIFGAQP
jgi:3-oxoacyl-[acyl-carrier-protein] synthase-1